MENSATLSKNAVENDTDIVSLLPPHENTQLFGHEDIEELLLKDIKAKRLPHAIILSGDEGIGKATLAFRLARYLLAKKSDSNNTGGLFGEEIKAEDESLYVEPENPIARKIAAKSHPDLKIIEPTNIAKDGSKRATKTISVEYARDIPHFLSHTSSLGGWRVVIVDNAETMNNNAQNAILKILEEPPEKTVLMLVTSEQGKILPTIHSRCRLINMKNLNDDVMLKLLAMTKIEDALKEDLLKIAKGRIGYAIKIYEMGGIELFQNIKKITENNMSDIEKYKFAEKIASKAETYDLCLEIILNYLVDKVKLTSINKEQTKYKWFDIYQKISNLYEMAKQRHLDKKATIIHIIDNLRSVS